MSRPLIASALLLVIACEPAPKPAEAPAAAMPEPAPGSTEWKIANATSAAPAAVAGAAAVMDWPASEGGDMTELRPGSNGWTCLPDVPSSPGNDPMCLDANALQWAAAWQGKTKPQLAGTGLGYMLQGGSDASNSDPYAAGPAAGEAWVETGPHIMIFPVDAAALTSLPTDPTSGGPYVMWQGTPYAHVMMPVQ